MRVMPCMTDRRGGAVMEEVDDVAMVRVKAISSKFSTAGSKLLNFYLNITKFSIFYD